MTLTLKGTGATQLQSFAAYNFNTGLTTSTTDANGQTTDYQYETDTLRPKKTIFPNDAYTETEYSDKLVSNPNDMIPGFVRTTTTLESNKFSQSYSYYDGKGQGIRGASQTPDGWSISAVEYDELGRPRKMYNPFYGSTPVAAITSGTKFSEVTGMDLLGRTTEVTLQDATKVTTAFGHGTDSTYVTVTDQAGKQRRQVMDALGRVIRVDEPHASGSLGTLTSPAQPTYYEYDANGRDQLILN